MWKIMHLKKKQAWTHARLHPINTIKPRKKTVNHPFKGTHHPEEKRKGPALFSFPLKLDKKPWTQLIVMWSSKSLRGVRGPLSLRVSFRQCKLLFLLYDQHQNTSLSRPESALTKSFSDLFLFIFNALRVGLSVYSMFQIQACHYRQYRAIK